MSKQRPAKGAGLEERVHHLLELRKVGFRKGSPFHLAGSSIALKVQAVSNPTFPLLETAEKNLLKSHLNDVGILTGILYGNNIRTGAERRKIGARNAKMATFA